MIKKILIGVIGLIIVLILVGFAIPRQFEASKSLTINAPADYIFDEVNDLEKNKNWSYWNSKYAEMTVSYSDVKAGQGATMEWDGPESGKGKMTITESVPYSSIKTSLDFMDEGSADGWFTFEPEGEGTKVTTGFSFDLGMNPLSRWIGVLMIKPEMNKSFEYNLARLKEIAEGKPRFTIPIALVETQPLTYVGISSTLNMDDHEAISAQMGKAFGELMAALQKSNVQATGAPFCIYPSWNEETREMEMVCALPVAPESKLPVKYSIQSMQGGKVLKAVHRGDYDGLEATHGEINKYIEFKQYNIAGAPYEVYITDPMVETDKSKWITEVYYPVNN